MIKQDMDLLVAGGFNLIRLFDSSDMVAKQTLRGDPRQQPGHQGLLGAYLAGYGNSTSTANDAEVARAIALANQFTAIVLAVSVGNEHGVWSTSTRSTPADPGRLHHKVRNGSTSR